MQSLNLSVSIDDMNLQANKAYNENKVLPAISQMKDTRTTSEILADIERTKVALLKEMEGLGTPNFNLAVLQRLERSPLNADGSLFVFFAQRAPELVKELKKGYRYGIVGDQNDIETFVKNVEDIYNKTKGMMSSVKSYFNRPATGMTTGTITEGEISKLIPHFREVARKLLLNSRNANPAINMRISEIAENLDQLYKIFSSKEFNMFTRVFNAITTNPTVFSPALVDTIFDEYKLVSDTMNELPKAETLYSLIGQLDKSLMNANAKLSMDILNELYSLTYPIAELKAQFDQARYTAMLHQPEIVAFFGRPTNIPQPTQVGGVAPEYISGHGLPFHIFTQEKKEIPTFKGVEQPTKRRGRPKGCGLKMHSPGDVAVGITPSPRYVTFGKFLINNNKLNDDIISIKRPSGGNITEFPSSKVSNKLSRVFKKIVGGQLPSYNELSDLTEEEKNYLYKVSKKAEILDKLSIPAPSKDKEEKDIHQFEVMKGEIMAGNDSKEMIKSFKLLLNKLSKSGALPKQQVSEVLTDLLEMGY
jgi:hypothetical protein